jgi:hypothetical protein
MVVFMINKVFAAIWILIAVVAAFNKLDPRLNIQGR